MTAGLEVCCWLVLKTEEVMYPLTSTYKIVLLFRTDNVFVQFGIMGFQKSVSTEWMRFGRKHTMLASLNVLKRGYT